VITGMKSCRSKGCWSLVATSAVVIKSIPIN